MRYIEKKINDKMKEMNGWICMYISKMYGLEEEEFRSMCFSNWFNVLVEVNGEVN